jgi:hypothetical protein
MQTVDVYNHSYGLLSVAVEINPLTYSRDLESLLVLVTLDVC